MANTGQDTYKAAQFKQMAYLMAQGAAAVAKVVGGKWPMLRLACIRCVTAKAFAARNTRYTCDPFST
jgi:hypothetical protein